MHLTPKITFVELLYLIDMKCVWNGLNMCIETTPRNEGHSIWRFHKLTITITTICFWCFVAL